MSDTIFMFGAGASAPLGLPITKGFFNNYTPPPTLEPLFNFICNCLANNRKDELDLESVFALLSFYRDISSNMGLNFLRYAFHTGEIQNIVNKNIVMPAAQPAFPGYPVTGYSPASDPSAAMAMVDKSRAYPLSSVSGLLDDLCEKARQLDKDIKHHVYSVFSDFESERAVSLYEPLFAPVLKEQKGTITIFTTNYDLILENVFNTPKGIRPQWQQYKVDNIYLGFHFRVLYFIFEPRFTPPENGTVELFKLHGSLNWDEHHGHVFMGGATRLPKDPEVPAFIYPGYNGLPEKEPFRSLHYLFGQRLHKADRFVCVGFSFRDVYLNTIISQALAANEKLELYAFNPEFPADSGFSLLKNHFTDRVHHVQGRVGEADFWELIESAD